MPPKGPERRTAPPVRRPMVGAAAAKAQAAEKTGPSAAEKKAAPAARPKPTAGGPKKATTIKKGPLKGLTSKKEAHASEEGGGAVAGKPKAQARKPTSELDEEDARGVRRSHDEYMSSAAQRMASLAAGLRKKGGGKTGLEDYEMDDDAANEAAEGGAMSMLDLLASLESDGGKTDLGIFASSVLQYSKVTSAPPPSARAHTHTHNECPQHCPCGLAGVLAAYRAHPRVPMRVPRTWAFACRPRPSPRRTPTTTTACSSSARRAA